MLNSLLCCKLPFLCCAWSAWSYADEGLLGGRDAPQEVGWKNWREGGRWGEWMEWRQGGEWRTCTPESNRSDLDERMEERQERGCSIEWKCGILAARPRRTLGSGSLVETRQISHCWFQRWLWRFCEDWMLINTNIYITNSTINYKTLMYNDNDQYDVGWIIMSSTLLLWF